MKGTPDDDDDAPKNVPLAIQRPGSPARLPPFLSRRNVSRSDPPIPIRPSPSPSVHPDRPTLDSARTFLVAASHTCRMRGARPHCSVHSQRGEGAREQGRIAFSFFASFSLSLFLSVRLSWGRSRDILLEATANRLEPLLPSRMSAPSTLSSHLLRPRWDGR